MKIKNRMKYFLIISLILTSCGIPKAHKLSKKAEMELSGVKKYLKCDEIGEQYTDETSNNKTSKYFQLIIIDKKRKDINYDSINDVLLDIYENDGLKLNQYTRISIYYLDNYFEADLDRAYFFDNKRNIIEIAYK
jgi:hypothetical protein